MIKQIRKFFDSQVKDLRATDQLQNDHALRMATATLMVEMIRADRSVLPSEKKLLLKSFCERFQLNSAEAEDLFQLAEDKADHATSLHEFTKVLNQQLDHAGKNRIVELFWDVALADDHIDKHEDYLVRKVSELIHVPHHEFIKAKHRAQEKIKTSP